MTESNERGDDGRYPESLDRESLGRKLLSQIYQQLRGRVPDWEIDDIAQDVALTVFSNESGFRQEKIRADRDPEEGMLAWVSGIVRLKRVKFFAEQNRRRQLLEKCLIQLNDLSCPVSTAPSSRLEAEEMVEAIEKALQNVSPALLAVARLYFAGCSHETICRELSISKEAAYVRLNRLRKCLREELEKLGDLAIDRHFIYASDPSVFESLGRPPRGQNENLHGDEDYSPAAFDGLVARLRNLDKQARQALRKARSVVDDEHGDLTEKDKPYFIRELHALAKKLGQSGPKRSLQDHLKRIREVSPAAASIILSAATLKSRLKHGKRKA